MKASFLATLVIAMQDKKIVVAVGLDPLAELAQIAAADPAIQIDPGGRYGIQNEFIE